MNILIGGDSWTHGYGVDESERWTSLVHGATITNVAESGFDNTQIANSVIKEHKACADNSFDLIIVCWSSMSRFKGCHFVDSKNHKKLKNVALKDMIMNFGQQVRKVEDLSTPVLHCTVFGDNFPFNVNNFLPLSFLEHLSMLSGYEWYLRIPFYESGMLQKDNEEFTTSFATKYFQDDWKYAIIEREMILLDKCRNHLLECGHPNPAGHKEWSYVINERICGL